MILLKHAHFVLKKEHHKIAKGKTRRTWKGFQSSSSIAHVIIKIIPNTQSIVEAKGCTAFGLGNSENRCDSNGKKSIN